MKHLILIIAFFFAVQAPAQIIKPRPDNIPKEFFKELPRGLRKDIRQDFAESKKAVEDEDNAYQIPPEESIAIPITPDLERVLNTEGSWGRSFLNIPENVTELTERIQGSRGVILYIFDTGEADHTAIRPFIVQGSSKSYTNEPVIDGHNHATHIAGSILGFTAQRNYGVLAEAAKIGKVKLIFRKICTNSGSCPNSFTAQAISDAAKEAADWIKKGYAVGGNLSIGGSADSKIIKDAIAEATDAGMVLFAANGNNGGSPAAYPGRDENTVGVAAIDKNSARASFSQYGNTTIFAAPGVLIPSFCKGDIECLMSGTSMATPHALAVWAAVKLLYPASENDDILNFMAAHASDINEPGFDKFTGYGVPKLKPYLDNEPSGDDEPDGPGDEPDEPIEREERALTILLEGPYTIRYHSASQSQSREAGILIVDKTISAITDRGEQFIYADAIASDINAVALSNIMIKVKSNRSLEAAYKAYSDAMQTFSSKYTLGLPAGADSHDAAYWGAYFFDLICERSFDLQLELVSIDADSKARLAAPDLRQWQSRPQGISKEDALYKCKVAWGFESLISGAGMPSYKFIDSCWITTEYVWASDIPKLGDFKPMKGLSAVKILSAEKVKK